MLRSHFFKINIIQNVNLSFYIFYLMCVFKKKKKAKASIKCSQITNSPDENNKNREIPINSSWSNTGFL